MFKQAANPDAEYPPMRFFNLSTEEEYHEIYAAYEHLAHKRKWPMESAYDKLLTRLMGEHATALEALSARATKAETQAAALELEVQALIRERASLVDEFLSPEDTANPGRAYLRHEVEFGRPAEGAGIDLDSLPSSTDAAGPGEAVSPYHIPSAAEARKMAHHIGYGPATTTGEGKSDE